MLFGSKKDFLAKAIEELVDNGVHVDLRATEFVDYEGSSCCSGFFQGTDTEGFLAMATKSPDWLEIFTHEFCHFKQWLERSNPESAWAKSFMLNPVTDKIVMAITVFDTWLQGNDIISPEVAKEAMQKARELEVDCEIRALNYIRNFDIVDPVQYAKKANTYLYAYPMFFKYRKWYKTPPYRQQSMIDLCPNIIQYEDHLIDSPLPISFEKEYYINCVGE